MSAPPPTPTKRHKRKNAELQEENRQLKESLHELQNDLQNRINNIESDMRATKNSIDRIGDCYK